MVNIHIKGSIHDFMQAKSHIHAEEINPSHVCLLCSKIMIPGAITMVLAQNIELGVIYLIPSKNTIGTCVVLAHGIGKG